MAVGPANRCAYVKLRNRLRGGLFKQCDRIFFGAAAHRRRTNYHRRPARSAPTGQCRRCVAVTMARRSPPHGLSKTTSKPRLTYRQWKTPDDIHDAASPFAIDDEICNARLQSRWQLADAIVFGRRTLAVAIEEARKHEGFQPGEVLVRWERTALLAERSHRTLSQLISHIGPRGVPSSDILGPSIRVPRSWAPSGRIKVGIVQRPQSRADAERELEALRKAREILQELAEHAQQRRDQLALARKNEGDPGKACDGTLREP